MEFNEIKKRFMLRCFSMRLADTTIKAYEEFFSSFGKFLESENKLNDFESIDSVVLRRYLIKLSTTMNGNTIEGYYRKLKTLFKFLLKEKLLTENPLDYVERPRTPKRKIQTFSSEEVFKMLNAYDTNDFIGLRNYTLLSFLLSTGVRRSEFVNLTMFDVDLQADIIRIIGKGDKERLIPIGKKLKLLLKRYVSARNEYLKQECKNKTCNAFFISRYGEKLKLSGANSIFQTLKKNLGLSGKRYSAHIWRHTFAKSYLLNGGDLFTLQEMLGHADIETTKIYINLTKQEVKMQNEQFNPLDNTKWQYY